MHLISVRFYVTEGTTQVVKDKTVYFQAITEYEMFTLFE